MSYEILNKKDSSFNFVLDCLVCQSQTRADSIKSLTQFSKKYLNILFNQRDAYSATKIWTESSFGDLKVGYNNGKIPYATNADLKKLFSKDLTTLLKDTKQQITFLQSDSAQLINGDEGDRYFLINFDFDKNLKIDSDLKSTSLDFISWDGGKTWKLNTDHWVGRFMYYLYRRNNR